MYYHGYVEQDWERDGNPGEIPVEAIVHSTLDFEGKESEMVDHPRRWNIGFILHADRCKCTSFPFHTNRESIWIQ